MGITEIEIEIEIEMHGIVMVKTTKNRLFFTKGNQTLTVYASQKGLRCSSVTIATLVTGETGFEETF